MKKQLKVEKNILRLSNREPFLVPDDLSFVIENTAYDLSNAFITLQNGDKKAHFKVSREFAIPADLLFAGILNFQIDIYYKGERIKRLVGAPLQIVETNDRIEIFDILTNIEERLSELEKIHEII